MYKHVVLYERIPASARAKVRQDIQVLVAEKYWEGCGGLVMRDEIQVAIAANVAIMAIGFVDQYFPRVQSILVYPDAYVAPSRTVMSDGLVLEGRSARSGEAWYRGPVILSWTDVRRAGRRGTEAHNVVIHEFAHQLDMLNGQVVDGTPPMPSPALLQRWKSVVPSEYTRLRQELEQGRPTLLDSYAATDIGEFFAVASETFFMLPHAMRRAHDQLYALFREFYQTDPAEWSKGPE